MKLEIFIAGVTLLFLLNTYYDGKILGLLKSYQKYYKMTFIAFVGFCVYIYIKRAPQNAKEFFSNANGYIKYLPIDRQTTSVLTPIIDFTGKALGDSIKTNTKFNHNHFNNFNNFNNLNGINNLTPQQRKILSSGKTT